jgi:uncharacterized protein YecE (DUF72 family)
MLVHRPRRRIAAVRPGILKVMSGTAIFIGTAGWCVTRPMRSVFAGSGTHLERYASRMTAAEINSSFHRPHAPATYAKWAAATPSGFRFAVKLPRTITHDGKLRRARRPLAQFLQETAGLGVKRGAVLVQLPPSFAFDQRVAGRFFDLLRHSYEGAVVCEPRHETWFTAAADRLLVRNRIARVGADPPPAPGGDVPAGWGGLVYLRLHGSPRKYWSRYPPAHIEALARQLRECRAAEAWCMFDNTASGAALENAWELRERLDPAGSEPA